MTSAKRASESMLTIRVIEQTFVKINRGQEST